MKLSVIEGTSFASAYHIAVELKREYPQYIFVVTINTASSLKRDVNIVNHAPQWGKLQRIKDRARQLEIREEK
jgi:hypothetical protein